MKRMHDDKELFDLLQEEGFLKEEVKVENINSDNAAQGEVLMADGSGGAEWSEIEAGMENPMTAKDDLIIGGTDGAPARLAKGTNGQVLQVGSSGLEWATPSGGGANIEEIQSEYFAGTYGDGYVMNTFTEASYNKFVNADVDTLFFLNFYAYSGFAVTILIKKYNNSSFYVVESPLFKKNTTSDLWYGVLQLYYSIGLDTVISINASKRFTISWTDMRLSFLSLDQGKFNALYCQKDAPSTDGTYVLKCTVVSGVKTYTWVSE